MRGVTAARTPAGVLRIHADAVHLARPDRPAPDVHLKEPVAAEKDTRIRVRQRQLHLLAVDVPGMRAVRQDIGDILVDEGASLSRQSSCKTKSRVFAVAPERLVALGLAAGVVVDDAVDDLPVAVVPLGHFPPGRSLPLKSDTNPSGTRWRASPGTARGDRTTRRAIFKQDVVLIMDRAPGSKSTSAVAAL